MTKFLVSAIALAIAPCSLAAAEPAKNQTPVSPASCPHMADGHAMHHAADHGTMPHGPAGEGQPMQHGDHAQMGAGDHHGHDAGPMQGQPMPHGDHPAMGQGGHHEMMHGEGHCPAHVPQEDGK